MNQRSYRRQFHFSTFTMALIFALGISASYGVEAQPSTPTGQAILFVSDRSGQPDLYIMQPDGSDVHRFVDSKFEEGGMLTSASLSPDGKYLAFTSRKDRSDHPTDAMFMLDMATGAISNLPSDNKYDNDFPAWSPDGRFLAYLVRGLFGNYAMLNIWDRTTQAVHSVITYRELAAVIRDDPAGMGRVDWSPDGQQLVLSVVTSPPTGYNMLVAINMDGTNARQVTPNGRGARFPTWRWQADFVYFICVENQQVEICNLNLQTSQIQAVTDLQTITPSGGKAGLTWLDSSADGQILFQFGGDHDIYRFDAIDGSVTNLPVGSGATNTAYRWINPMTLEGTRQTP